MNSKIRMKRERILSISQRNKLMLIKRELMHCQDKMRQKRMKIMEMMNSIMIMRRVRKSKLLIKYLKLILLNKFLRKLFKVYYNNNHLIQKNPLSQVKQQLLHQSKGMTKALRLRLLLKRLRINMKREIHISLQRKHYKRLKLNQIK